MPPGTSRVVLGLYVATSFLGSGLLFLIQPMVGKMLLPELGGAPAVWNVAMVFFQTTLLLGYAWAHASLGRLDIRKHVGVQVSVFALSMLWLPIGLPDDWIPSGAPALWVIWVLAVAVGGPFFVLSTASPTVQRWLSLSQHEHGRDPYFLYAAGNVGSLLGLLAYPLLIEPRMSLDAQARLWGGLYAVLLALTVAAGAVVIRYPRAPAMVDVASPIKPVERREQLRWIVLAAVPSMLLIGVTQHITTDVAAIPLLWVVPLSIYLITFIVAFGRNPRQLEGFSGRVLKIGIIPLAITLFAILPLWAELGTNLLVFGAAAMLAHSRLARSRPDPGNLTRFYLSVSLGGALGGITAALIAPVVFPVVLEYPLALAGALVFLPVTLFKASRRLSRRSKLAIAVGLLGLAALPFLAQAADSVILAAGTIGLAAYLLISRPVHYALVVGLMMVGLVLLPLRQAIVVERSFFGVTQIRATDDGRYMVNGTTLHGFQFGDPDRSMEPTTYFSRSGPAGDVMKAALRPGSRTGVVGLGVGTLAAFGGAGSEMVFFEIDPTVIEIASDASLFTFLAGSDAEIVVLEGDGRLLLEAEQGSTFDLVVIDAFSSDSIPMHLISLEALSLYLDLLKDGGLVAYHITNRHLDLAPIIARQAEEMGAMSMVRDDSGDRYGSSSRNLGSRWIVVGRRSADLGLLRSGGQWEDVAVDPQVPLWTDSFSDLLSVVR